MGDSDNGSIQTVTLSQGFWMGQTEVTQAQWQAVMGNNPSKFAGCPNCPVENLSWNDAQNFVRKMNERNDSSKYRLPTTAEWEYACWAGTTGAYYSNPDTIGWYNVNSGGKTNPVGQKQPNKWGLYDMSGNVWEWARGLGWSFIKQKCN